jgi:predicted RNA-binding Zn ribbon-like protein
MNRRQDLREAMLEMPLRIGESLCLDFINTREPRGDPSLSEQQRATQHEYLSSYTDFLAWSVQASVVTEEDAWHLLEQATLSGSQTKETLSQIIMLRENLYMLFWNIASTQSVEAQALEWVHQSYLDALFHAKLIKGKEHYTWQWNVEKEHLASPTWPIVQSALELLTAGDHSRIKICPGPPRAWMACGWLFYDESKNRGRHWCSMADCGNRSKAQRQTARRRVKRKQHQP